MWTCLPHYGRLKAFKLWAQINLYSIKLLLTSSLITPTWEVKRATPWLSFPQEPVNLHFQGLCVFKAEVNQHHGCGLVAITEVRLGLLYCSCSYDVRQFCDLVREFPSFPRWLPSCKAYVYLRRSVSSFIPVFCNFFSLGFVSSEAMSHYSAQADIKLSFRLRMLGVQVCATVLPHLVFPSFLQNSFGR